LLKKITRFSGEIKNFFTKIVIFVKFMFFYLVLVPIVAIRSLNKKNFECFFRYQEEQFITVLRIFYARSLKYNILA